MTKSIFLVLTICVSRLWSHEPEKNENTTNISIVSIKSTVVSSDTIPGLRLDEEEYIQYNLNEYVINIPKPIWWDSINLSDKINQENCPNIVGQAFASDDYRVFCKADFLCSQIANSIPYRLINNARDAGDHQLGIDLGLGFLEYLQENPQDRFSWNHYYSMIGESYMELGNIELSKFYYKKAIPVEKANIHGQTYYSNKAKEALSSIANIKDETIFFSKRAEFRNSLNNRIDTLNSNSQYLAKIRYETKDFLWSEQAPDLNTLQIAFLDIIKKDLNSENSKVLTPDLIAKIKKTLFEYHLEKVQDFEIKPLGISFPTDINNNWYITFEGKDFEIVSASFNRWELLDIGLSD